MRVLIVTFALLCALVAGALAQQANSSTDEAKGKKTKNTEPAAKNQEKKPAEKARKANPPPKSRSRRLPNRGPTRTKKNLTSPKFRRW